MSNNALVIDSADVHSPLRLGYVPTLSHFLFMVLPRNNTAAAVLELVHWASCESQEHSKSKDLKLAAANVFSIAKRCTCLKETVDPMTINQLMAGLTQLSAVPTTSQTSKIDFANWIRVNVPMLQQFQTSCGWWGEASGDLLPISNYGDSNWYQRIRAPGCLFGAQHPSGLLRNRRIS